MGASLQDRLDAACQESGSVGAVASICIDGERLDAASGIADVRGSRHVTPETPFRLGSITKVLTSAALVSLFADAGRSLDERIDGLMPGCVPEGADVATWRHVLTHRSGIDGTFWEGCGDEPDAIRRYAEQVSSLPMVFDPGDSWAYSNSGYVLAGAALEALTGQTYDQVVTERLLQPLDVGSTIPWSQEPPPGAANGHHMTADGARPADAPIGLRALAPAGSSAYSTAADALVIAEALLGDAGTTLAAEAGPLPPGGGTAATHQTLGWKLYRWGDTVMFGHDGGASGTGSFLRWIPERRAGIAVMANTNPSAMFLWADLSEWFFEQIGLSVPPRLSAAGDARPEPHLCGEYRNRDAVFTVGSGEDDLTLEMAGPGGATRGTAELRPLRPGIYRSGTVLTDPTRIISFEEPRGAYRLLHAGPFTAREVVA